MRIEENYSLEKHNTFHLPVKARWFMEYTNEEELGRSSVRLSRFR